MRDRLVLLGSNLIERLPESVEASAYAVQYLRVLDSLACIPEQSGAARAPVSEALHAALLSACQIAGVGSSARPKAKDARTGAPSQKLLATMIYLALRCEWLWAPAEIRALTALRAEGSGAGTATSAAPVTARAIPIAPRSAAPASACIASAPRKPPIPDTSASDRRLRTSSVSATSAGSCSRRPPLPATADVYTAEQARQAELLLPTLPDAAAGAVVVAMESERTSSSGRCAQGTSSYSGGGDRGGGDRHRLELVLDLDHTLVHACELGHSAHARLDASEAARSFSLRKHPSAPEMRYKLCLRDGVHAFLREVRTFCVVHVYTMGSQSYTRQVLTFIDPASSAIDGDILCRKDDDEQAFEKSLYHFEGCNDPAAQRRRDRMIIIDDREEVWCVQSRPHVLPVPQFRVWDAEGAPIARPAGADATLFDMLAVLRAVRDDLASGTAHCVPSALKRRRRSILAGCVLVFSGGLLKDAHRPELNASWRMAETLGARCEIYFDPQVVSHVVSAAADTGSVKKALAHGLHAVSHQWLLDTFFRWHRQDEALYAHGPRPPSRQRGVGDVGRAPLAANARLGDDSSRHCGENGGTHSAESDVERACRLTRELLVPASRFNDSQRLAVAIHFLVPTARKAETRTQLQRFEAANGKDETASAAALERITEIVGRQELKTLVAKLTGAVASTTSEQP